MQTRATALSRMICMTSCLSRAQRLGAAASSQDALRSLSHLLGESPNEAQRAAAATRVGAAPPSLTWMQGSSCRRTRMRIQQGSGYGGCGARSRRRGGWVSTRHPAPCAPAPCCRSCCGACRAAWGNGRACCSFHETCPAPRPCDSPSSSPYPPPPPSSPYPPPPCRRPLTPASCVHENLRRCGRCARQPYRRLPIWRHLFQPPSRPGY